MPGTIYITFGTPVETHTIITAICLLKLYSVIYTQKIKTSSQYALPTENIGERGGTCTIHTLHAVRHWRDRMSTAVKTSEAAETKQKEPHKLASTKSDVANRSNSAKLVRLLLPRWVTGNPDDWCSDLHQFSGNIWTVKVYSRYT